MLSTKQNILIAAFVQQLNTPLLIENIFAFFILEGKMKNLNIDVNKRYTIYTT